MEARLTTTNVVVGSVDFKERFVYLASTIHRRYSCMYIYIYIERIYTIAMYIIGSTTKNVDLVSGFSCKSRQGRSTFVCVCVCQVQGC